MLKLENISVKYKNKVVLDNLSFSAESGEIIGLVAPNGTGKTTLFNVISNFLKPNKGKVTFNGKTQYKTERNELTIHKRLATFPEQSDLFEELSGVDHMKLYANMWKGSHKHVKDVYRNLHMEGYVKKKVKTYSLGMRQRLCFAMIVAADTPIMLMDEVMNGLDVANVSLISKCLMQMKQEGKLIFVASHLLENLDLYADRVLYLKDGNIVHQERLNEGSQEYVKIELTKEEYEKLTEVCFLPKGHLFIANHLCCIPIEQRDKVEQEAWFKKLFTYQGREITIGSLGTMEYYEKYYHEN